MSELAPIPVSPNWDDVRSYEEIKAKTLYAYVGSGAYLDSGVYCVLEEVKVYERIFRLYGVSIGHDRYGIDVSSEFSLDPDHMHEWVQAGKAHLTRNVDGAVREFLTRANVF